MFFVVFGTQGLAHNLYATLCRHERDGVIIVTHKPDSSARIDYVVELAAQERAAGRPEVYIRKGSGFKRAGEGQAVREREGGG